MGGGVLGATTMSSGSLFNSSACAGAFTLAACCACLCATVEAVAVVGHWATLFRRGVAAPAMRGLLLVCRLCAESFARWSGDDYARSRRSLLDTVFSVARLLGASLLQEACCPSVVGKACVCALPGG